MNTITYNETARGCWECTSHRPCTSGYPRAYVRGRATRVHRIVFEKSHGPIPNGMVVRHRCDNRLCVNPAHLVVGTVADNCRDMAERGRSTRGERNPKARLTEADVLAIRASTEGARTLGRRFGIVHSAIVAIRQRKLWRHLP